MTERVSEDVAEAVEARALRERDGSTGGARHAEPDVEVDLADAAVTRHAEAGTGVVIDLTDAAVARHGGPVIRLGTDAAASAAALPGARALPVLWSPLALLLAVNALNVLDAALTVLWIDMGIAFEANPIVDAIGFPAKVVVVAIGSYVVYRLRPRWLAVPALALAAVCVYHVVGAAVVLRS